LEALKIKKANKRKQINVAFQTRSVKPKLRRILFSQYFSLFLISGGATAPEATYALGTEVTNKLI